MSKETHKWLSENTLIGFTEKRGNAWHYREGDANHYVGAIPLQTVKQRLFAWTAQERDLFIPNVTEVSGATVIDVTDMVRVPGRKAIVRSDNGHVMGVFKSGYQPHQYEEWLLDNVGKLLDDGLSIGSAGLLSGGAVAWVSVEMPDNIVTPEGVEFRPNLLAATSFDGTVATTYKRVFTNVVCDNTMSYALREKGSETVKVRHSSRSLAKLADARTALGIVYDMADDISKEIAEMCAVKFDDKAFESLIDVFAPQPGMDASKRAVTMADTKRDKLWDLWLKDDRVTPWRGNAFGAWQAFSTFDQHAKVSRGLVPAERNMMNAVKGFSAQSDAEFKLAIMSLAA